MTSTAALLSVREKQIIKYISSGFTNEEIGNNLYISKETVKSHKHRLFRKLKAKNAANLVHLIHCSGFFNNPDSNNNSTSNFKNQ